MWKSISCGLSRSPCLCIDRLTRCFAPTSAAQHTVMLSGLTGFRHSASAAASNRQSCPPHHVKYARFKCFGAGDPEPRGLFRPTHSVTQQWTPLCRAGKQSTETITQQDLVVQAASSHATHILELCKKHDLEALIPYMSEMSVVKAVVR